MAYVGKRGTLNLGMRMEGLLANIAVLITTGAGIKKTDGGKFEMRDFMPHAEQEAQPVETDVTAVLKLLRGGG